jgi:hypothetical protein
MGGPGSGRKKGSKNKKISDSHRKKIRMEIIKLEKTAPKSNKLEQLKKYSKSIEKV